MIRNRTEPLPEPRPATGRSSTDDLLAAVPGDSRGREVAVGFFVLAGVIALLVALFTLTDAGAFRGRYTVATRVESAGGVRRGDPVQMRGVNIGRVRGFEIIPGGVAIQLELEGDYGVPADSRVVLRSQGLLGGTVAEVIPGTAESDLDDGDLIPGATEAGPLETAGAVGTRADDVLTRVQALLSQQTIGAVEGSATELQALLAELQGLASEQRRGLASLSESLQRSAGGVERATTGPELERALTRVDSITLRLDQSSQSLGAASRSLETVLGRLERGEGTLGKLSRDDSLYVNLNQAAANINQLASDIRENPKKYLSVSVF